MSKIDFNFSQAKKQSEELALLASELTGLVKKEYAETMQVLAANWHGANADAYLNKGAMLQENMERTSKDLGVVSMRIGEIAKSLWEAEQRAKEIVK